MASSSLPPSAALQQLKIHFGDARRKLAAQLHVCHVCGARDHFAGFEGTVYRDCLGMPCYVCKLPGHSTSTCPHRIDSRLTLRASGGGVCALRARELGSSGAMGRTALGRELAPSVARCWRLEAALLRLHTRRITALTFLPGGWGQRALSGDKGGELAVWSVRGDRSERSVWVGHRWMVSALSPDPDHPTSVWSSSCDGTLRLHDLPTRTSALAVALNPAGASAAAASAAAASAAAADTPGKPSSSWRMFYSVAALQGGCALAGDADGALWHVDRRAPAVAAGALAAHRARSRVTSLSVHPLSPHHFASSSNDHTVRLWDARMCSFASVAAGSTGGVRGGSGRGGSSGAATGSSAGCSTRGLLAHLALPRSVTSVAFSPHTGRRLAATCMDNRIYTWDEPACLGLCQQESGGVHLWDGASAPAEGSSGSACWQTLPAATVAPSTATVHSHDFARFLSPFRAIWYTPDHQERSLLCGRFISESFTTRSGVKIKLHPVDLLDCGPPVPPLRQPPLDDQQQQQKQQRRRGPSHVLAQLAHPIVTTISPVLACHPTQPLVLAGSSKNLYLWAPWGEGLKPGAPLEIPWWLGGGDAGEVEGEEEGKGGGAASGRG